MRLAVSVVAVAVAQEVVEAVAVETVISVNKAVVAVAALAELQATVVVVVALAVATTLLQLHTAAVTEVLLLKLPTTEATAVAVAATETPADLAASLPGGKLTRDTAHLRFISNLFLCDGFGIRRGRLRGIFDSSDCTTIFLRPFRHCFFSFCYDIIPLQH